MVSGTQLLHSIGCVCSGGLLPGDIVKPVRKEVIAAMGIAELDGVKA